MSSNPARPLSLSLRVMLFVMLAIGLSLFIISRLVLSTVERHFDEQDADELRVMVDSIAHSLMDMEVGATELPLNLASTASSHHGAFYEVRNSQGRLLYSSSALDFTGSTVNILPAATIDMTTTSLWEVQGKTYRGAIAAREINGQRYLITTAIDMEFHKEFLESFSESLWFILFGAGVITLLAAWGGVHQGLRPLRGVTASVRAIQTNKLDTRLDADAVPVELQDLVHSFNQMIEQLELGFSKLSHFSDDIAHELRTPLTNMITQTQVGLSQARSDADYRELLYSVLEEQERLTKMVNDMLWLAKTENGLLSLKNTTIDVREEFLSLFEFFDALAEERQVSLTIGSQAVKTQGDRELLRRAFTNLLSNAIAHSTKKSAIKVTLTQSATSIEVRVENTGQEIPEKHLARIFERFYRVDPSRQRNAEGVGLGLAIVKSVIEAHAGSIKAESSNGSTRFIAQLPTA